METGTIFASNVAHRDSLVSVKHSDACSNSYWCRSTAVVMADLWWVTQHFDRCHSTEVVRRLSKVLSDLL